MPPHQLLVDCDLQDDQYHRDEKDHDEKDEEMQDLKLVDQQLLVTREPEREVSHDGVVSREASREHKRDRADEAERRQLGEELGHHRRHGGGRVPLDDLLHHLEENRRRDNARDENERPEPLRLDLRRRENMHPLLLLQPLMLLLLPLLSMPLPVSLLIVQPRERARLLLHDPRQRLLDHNLLPRRLLRRPRGEDQRHLLLLGHVEDRAHNLWRELQRRRAARAAMERDALAGREPRADVRAVDCPGWREALLAEVGVEGREGHAHDRGHGSDREDDPLSPAVL
mmetsp:Transcript_45222/g.106508  ORF Transcript_45222/g.106508 Transcript_45222/m.106508 type:complete len:284 (-) Transcript_45222:134-985(-)